MYLKLILLLSLLPLQENPYCKMYGSFYEVDSPSKADFIIYEELSEPSADLIVYEETNRLYADRPGIWFFEEKESFARYRVFFTNKPGKADVKVFFTEYESFAGCNQ